MATRKLWRIPEKGMIKGVCAGLAQYFDVPVKLIRAIAVLSIFFGLGFFVLIIYIALSFILDPMPPYIQEAQSEPAARDILSTVDAQLMANEEKLRMMERYITSDSFTLRNSFRKL